MTDTVLVKPWPGLILAGIPRAGARIPRALAEEWIGNHLVIAVPVSEPRKPTPDIRPINQRRTSK